MREGHEELAAWRDEAARPQAERKTEAQGRLNRLYRDRVAGDVPESTYRNLRPEYEAALAAIDDEQREQAGADRSTWEESLGLVEAVSNSAATFWQADGARRREMARGLLSNCQIVEGRVVVALRPWFKTLLDANVEAERNGLDGGLSGNWYSGRDSNPRPSP